MRIRLSPPWAWIVAVGSLACLLALAYLVHQYVRSERLAESGGEAVQVPRSSVNRVVKLGAELAASHGIVAVPARPVSWERRSAVYGRIVPNPQATVEVRAPFAGILREMPDALWPMVGREVRGGQPLGRLDIRVSSLERLDLQAKLGEARRKLEGSEEVLRIQQGRLERLRKVSGAAIVTQRELDDGQVAIADARTQAEMARASAELWDRALQAINRRDGRTETGWSEFLTAPIGGEVTELFARPGTTVEPGTAILRLVDFRRVLVRMDLPPTVLAAGAPAEIELTAGTEQGAVQRAVLIGPAPQVDAASQLAGYWYEIRPSDKSRMTQAWRPGLFVRAAVRSQAGQPVAAVAVPHSALLYHEGRSLVYVRISPGRFERREVQVLGQDGTDWVLADGVTAGEAIVSRQAQVLLSEEFRSDQDND
jgi:RND family efflux transporter MFP subunit